MPGAGTLYRRATPFYAVPPLRRAKLHPWRSWPQYIIVCVSQSGYRLRGDDDGIDDGSDECDDDETEDDVDEDLEVANCCDPL